MMSPREASTYPLRAALLACALTACSDEPATEVSSGELCGQSGPFKLLALDEDQRLLSDGSVRRFGDIYTVTVGHEPRTQVPGAPSIWPTYAHTTTYRVGLCGQDPRIIAEDLAYLLTLERWPDARLACRGEDLVTIDLAGGAAPTIALERGCGLGRRVVDEGIVLQEPVGDDHARVLYHPFLDGPEPAFAPAVELFSAIRRPAARSDEILGIDDEGALRSVSLVDLTQSVEAEGVVLFAATDDHLLWASVEGDVYLRDRHSASEALVGDGPLSPYGLLLQAAFARLSRPSRLDGETLVDLNDGAVYTIPPGRWAVTQLEDGRWLTSSEVAGPWALRDLHTGVEQPLSARRGFYWVHPDRLELVEGAGLNLDPREAGPLWRIPYDGPERLLARRAAPTYITLSDDRIVTPVAVDSEWLGALVLIDPDTLDERRIDASVFNFTGRAAALGALEPDVIAYQVVEGARTGVYLLNLAP